MVLCKDIISPMEFSSLIGSEHVFSLTLIYLTAIYKVYVMDFIHWKYSDFSVSFGIILNPVCIYIALITYIDTFILTEMVISAVMLWWCLENWFQWQHLSGLMNPLDQTTVPF